MMKPQMLEAFNRQIGHEYYSSYLYLSMAAWCEEHGLPGMAQWMQVQAQEEIAHALRFFNFIYDRGGKVVLGEIAAPPREWADPLALFGAVAAHEAGVTDSINHLVDLSLANSDHASWQFLQWFIGEQVEEEASVAALIDQLRLIGDHGPSLLILDKELGQRPAILIDPKNLPA